LPREKIGNSAVAACSRRIAVMRRERNHIVERFDRLYPAGK
jgi:hypothetical protein